MPEISVYRDEFFVTVMIRSCVIGMRVPVDLTHIFPSNLEGPSLSGDPVFEDRANVRVHWTGDSKDDIYYLSRHLLSFDVNLDAPFDLGHRVTWNGTVEGAFGKSTCKVNAGVDYQMPGRGLLYNSRTELMSIPKKGTITIYVDS